MSKKQHRRYTGARIAALIFTVLLCASPYYAHAAGGKIIVEAIEAIIKAFDDDAAKIAARQDAKAAARQDAEAAYDKAIAKADAAYDKANADYDKAIAKANGDTEAYAKYIVCAAKYKAAAANADAIAKAKAAIAIAALADAKAAYDDALYDLDRAAEAEARDPADVKAYDDALKVYAEAKAAVQTAKAYADAAEAYADETAKAYYYADAKAKAAALLTK